MSAFVDVQWAQPRAVWTELVTPPVEEPFTVEEIKLRASLAWPVTDPPDPRDAMIADMIAAARHKVELDTGLALLTQVRRATFTTAATCGVVPLPANCLPVQSITDVTGAMRLRTRTARLSGSHRLSVVGLAVDSDEVTSVLELTVGWPSVAEFKAEAPALYQAVALLAVHNATLGRDLAVTGAVAAMNVVPEGYQALIAPHQLVWVA